MTADARTALLLATMALGLAGCEGAVDARALDRICASKLPGGPACEVFGDGALVPGVTGDTYGFGLIDAEIVIHIAAMPELRTPGPFEISLLAVARDPGTTLDFALSWGSCPNGCPPEPKFHSTILPTEYAWVPVASGVRGTRPDAAIPDDAVVIFTAANTDIADLRIRATP
jgi:hypothetical protein